MRLSRHFGDAVGIQPEANRRADSRGSPAPALKESGRRLTPESGPLGPLERLRRLHPSPAWADESDSKVPGPSVFVPPRRADPLRQVTLGPSLELEEVRVAGTQCLAGSVCLSPGVMHGGRRLDEGLRLTGATAQLLSGDVRLREFDVTRAAFFDLETSGLLGGSGNLAFLSGFAQIDAQGAVSMHQVLIRHPTEEPAALSLITDLLDGVDFLVSFNGKSFDRNVLADRFVMNRMNPSRVLDLPHVDLLHPSRRLFRGLLESCSLSALEEEFLAVHRHESEVRGAEVPQRWFDYLRGGAIQLLEPVIEHNVLDVLSLVTLAGLLGACVDAPGLFLPQPRAQVALSRLLIERGDVQRAEELLRLLGRGQADDPIVYSALGLLAGSLRRSGRFEEAVAVWMRMIEAAGASDLEPWLGAMITLEHRLRRPHRALELIEEVLGGLDEGGLWRTELPALHHRRARLRRKTSRSKFGHS